MSPISPQAERRRRIVTRLLPVVLIGVVAFVAGVLVGGTSAAEETARRFVDAWARGDHPAMHGQLSADAADRYPQRRFARLYEEAEVTATVEGIEPDDPAGTGSISGQEVVNVPVTARTHAFGEISANLALPVDDDAVAWEPHLVFPGLAPGEELDRNVEVPKRAPILARDRTPLADGDGAGRSSSVAGATLYVAGELGAPKGEQAAEVQRDGFPTSTLVGTSGLEQAFQARLAGQPGGELMAIGGEGGNEAERVLGAADPVAGEPVRTTINPDLQEATVEALGDTFGGAAVLDADNGNVLAVAGIAFSSPQPPGSTFKIVTTVAALERGVVKLSDTFPVQTATNVGGREISNAHDEPCGGTFAQSFARSCNTVFAPLGPEVGNDQLVKTSERFGFNSPPTLYNAEATAIIKPGESTIPTSIGTDLDLGVTAIGQGKVLATPLEMASIAQTIAAGGVRSPTPLVTEPELGPNAEPVKVTSGQIASTVRDLMVGVVDNGTGVAAAIPDVEVAGKTGTAELGPAPVDPEEDGGEPEQEQDAWFTAFAPAGNPKLAVAVLVASTNEDGGTVAAPIAREILTAAL